MGAQLGVVEPLAQMIVAERPVVARVRGLPDLSHDPIQRCTIHALQNCAECWQPAPNYRRGYVPAALPAGYFVRVRGGNGVYHHPTAFT